MPKSNFENFTYEKMLFWVDQEAEKKIKNGLDVNQSGGISNVQKRVDS